MTKKLSSNKKKGALKRETSGITNKGNIFFKAGVLVQVRAATLAEANWAAIEVWCMEGITSVLNKRLLKKARV